MQISLTLAGETLTRQRKAQSRELTLQLDLQLDLTLDLMRLPYQSQSRSPSRRLKVQARNVQYERWSSIPR
jgi:hypothetical protein